MTTIAWDGKSLAADRCGTRRSLRFPARKIFHILMNPDLPFGLGGIAATNTEDAKPLNGLVGFVGDMSWALPVRYWLQHGGAFPKLTSGGEDSVVAVIIRKKLPIRILGFAGQQEEVLSGFFTFGAGDEVAMGALEMGADAGRAVEITAWRTMYGAFGVDVLDFDSPLDELTKEHSG